MTSAERVEAGAPAAAGQPGMTNLGAQPAHCKIAGTIEKEIRFELLLPDKWNGQFVMGGGGGFVGSVQNTAQTSMMHADTALDRGYATAGTDTGHQAMGTDASWALNNPERELNFGHRAVHLTAEASKTIIKQFYGRDAEQSYFIGCSRGGGQGMMESQRYPDDFDGIVAGAPAYNWPGIGAGFVQTQQKMYPDPANLASPVITNANRALLAQEILAACDKLDGVEDRLLDDPRRCKFDPAKLQRCADAKGGDDCVTEPQLAAIQEIYEGPIVNGKRVHAGFPFGGENDFGGWDTWITGRPNAFGPRAAQPAHGVRHQHVQVHHLRRSQVGLLEVRVRQLRPGHRARGRDPQRHRRRPLRSSRSRRGKLILWNGWSDSAITALGTIGYYDWAAAKDKAVADYARLFLLPGVLHCAGGPGPDKVDWLAAISEWVEQDKAPERLLASRADGNGKTILTRPLCPYPQVAVWDGKGEPSKAESFACGAR